MSTYIPHNPTLGPARPPSEREDHPSTHDQKPNEWAEPDQCDEPVLPPDYIIQHSEPVFQTTASHGSDQSESQTGSPNSSYESESETQDSEQSAYQNNLPALLPNEDPSIQVQLVHRLAQYVDAFDKAVRSNIRVQKAVVGILEASYGIWDLCRLNEQARAAFEEECRRVNLKVSEKAGEFISFLKFVQPYWERECHPSKEARESARDLINRNNRFAAALTGLKIHIMRRYGEFTPYRDGIVTELLTNKNTEFGSIEAAVQFGREQSDQPSDKATVTDAEDGIQQSASKEEVLIPEGERVLALSLHHKNHHGLELSLKTWRNGRPTSYRIVSLSSEKILTLGVSPSTPEEEEAFAFDSKDDQA
jgi:hypothetical protein